MPTDDAEIASYKTISDPQKISDKRSARKTQLTKLDNYFKPVFSTSFEKVKLDDLQRRQKELNRQLMFLDALQERYEELLTTVSPSTKDDEIASGEAIRARYQVLVDQVQNYIDQVILYEEGMALIDSLEALDRAESLASVIYQDKVKALENRSEAFRKRSRHYETDTEIEPIREKLQALIAAAYDRIARDLSATEPTASPVELKEVKPDIRFDIPVKVDMPNFSGDPMDWFTFKDLFTTNLKDGYPKASQNHKATLLAKAMGTDEARRIVNQHAVGDKRYDDALKALDDFFGDTTKIFPQYLKDLIKPDTYSYDQKGLRRMMDTFRRARRGMESCKACDADHILGGLIISRLDSQARYEWNNHGGDASKLPTDKEVLDFFQTRERRMYNMPAAPKPFVSKLPVKKHSSPANNAPTSRTVNRVQGTTYVKCPACDKGGHSISRCSVFVCWTPEKRQEAVRKANLCFNCLSYNH